MRLLRSLLHNQSGAYALEFALTFPVVIALMLGSVDLGYQYTKQAVLVGAVRDATRTAIAKSAGCSKDRSALIEGMIQQAMEPFAASSDAVKVTIRAYGSGFGAVGKPEPLTKDDNGNGRYDPGDSFTDINGDGKWSEDQGKVGNLGGPGDVVAYKTEFEAKPLFLFLPMIGNGKVLNLTASTVVRNEPYKCDT